MATRIEGECKEVSVWILGLFPIPVPFLAVFSSDSLVSICLCLSVCLIPGFIFLIYLCIRDTGYGYMCDFILITISFLIYRAEADAKKADAARKKAERDALLATEEANQPSKPKGAGSKSAQKKSGAPPPSRGLDLSQLDSTPSAALSASGIENALDALEITASPDSTKVDRHPERRFKAAYAAFEARRLPEMDAEFPGLRKQQKIEKCRKEFEKSEENPFNKAHVAFDSSRDEIVLVKESERKKIEVRLTTK